MLCASPRKGFRELCIPTGAEKGKRCNQGPRTDTRHDLKLGPFASTTEPNERSRAERAGRPAA